MAKKHLMSFQPWDVTEVILRCRNCGSGLSISILRAQAIVPGVSHCHGCRADWDTSGPQQEHLRELRQLLEALRYFSPERGPWAVEMVIEDRLDDSVQSGP